jgi:hypothetical protein
VQLIFEVGSQERHQIDFTFDQFWGGLNIRVDGEPVVDQVQMFSVRLTNDWDFEIGENERHHVRIEKRRKLFLGGFRPQLVTAFVDGQQVASQDR